MMPTQARVRKASEPAEIREIEARFGSSRGAPRAATLPAEVVLAATRAASIVAAAEQRAAALLEHAERRAAEVRLAAEAQGRATGAAQLAARALVLASHEARADERQLERMVDLARLLAERLLGETLALDPHKVAGLARQALREARGARRIVIHASPDDCRMLERSLSELGFEKASVEVVGDPARSAGNLRIETEIGSIDAALAPQLERLAATLRESLQHGR